MNLKPMKTKIIITVILAILVPTLSYFIAKMMGISAENIGIVLLGFIVTAGLAILGALWGKDILHKITSHSSEDEKTETVHIVKQNPYDENAHLQTLNTVYQKLYQMRLWETSQNVWFMQTLVELNGTQLMHATNTPDLNRALEHLKKNDRYKNLVDLWYDLESCVSTYNNNIPSFVELLENHIRKIMSTKTKYIEQKNDEGGYTVISIRCALMYLLPLKMRGHQLLHSFDLRISKVYNTIIWFETQPQIVENGLFVIVNGNAEEIRDEIGKLLLAIAVDKTVLNKYKPHYDRLQKMKKAEQKFKDNLQPLIYDIEKNGFTIKGICDIGY